MPRSSNSFVSTSFTNLYRQVDACTVCPCSKSNRKAPGVGNRRARVLLLGQNPGNPHPGAGFVPFDFQVWGTGLDKFSSGTILQSMLRLAKIDTDDIYITNVQKCGGPPDSRYVTNCADWLEEELILLRKVQFLIPMGQFAIKRLGATIGKLEQYESRFNRTRTWLMTGVAHPASLLRPFSLGMTAYEKQWRFVGACYRQLERV